MNHFFDDLARGLGSNISRRQAFLKAGGILVGAALGAVGLGSRAYGETLLNCNNYCRQYPVMSQFINCRNVCLNCSSASNMCGSGAAPTCCTGGANGSPSCSSGTCGITCSAGYANCDNNLSNGCETNTNTDPSNCGSCGHICNAANATSGCVSGNCTITSCAPGFADCDGNSANGCETNTNTNVNNCGACGHACSLPNATAACSGGSCVVASCNAGYANCDGIASDGCETNIFTSTTNCGSCGHVCTAGQICAAGNCITT